MLAHLHQNLIGNSGDIRAGQSAFCHMQDIADAGRDDLGLNISRHLEGLNNITDQSGTVLIDVIQSAQER